MRWIIFWLGLLTSAALAAPNTTQPSVNNMTVSNCASNVPIIGAGSGNSGLGCGTVSGNTAKFMTGSGAFTNGDIATFDANGNIVDGGSGAGGGTSITDQGAFTFNSTSLTPIGGVYIPNSSLGSLSSGQAGVLRLTPERFILQVMGMPTNTGTVWNSGTAGSATQVILSGTSAMQGALVQLDQSGGTFSGGAAITFEGSYDSTAVSPNWVALQSNQVIDPTSNSGASISIPYTLQSGIAKPFLLFARGFQQIRMRLSTAISGTGTVTPYITAIPYGDYATFENQVNGLQKTQIVDGSGNVIASTANNLNVQCANCSGSGVVATDTTSFVTGTSIFAPGGGFFQTTATSNALSNGQQGAFQVTAQRALFVNLRNASGTEIATSSNPIVTNLGQVGGSAVVTGATGLLQVAVVGNAGAKFDQVAGANAVPANALYEGINVAGNLRGWTGVNPTGTVFAGQVDIASIAGSTVGTATTGVMQVGILGGAGARIDAATAASVPANALYNGINVAGNMRGWTGSNPTGTVFAGQIDFVAINGTTAVTAAGGVLKVGIVGNANNALDAAVTAGTAPANMLAVGGLFNTAAPTPSNGQSVALQVDQSSNLRVAPGIGLGSFAAWGSGTTVGTTDVVYTNSGVGSVLIELNQGGGISAGQVTFDASYDGSNWTTGLQADQVLDPNSPTLAQITMPYSLVASTVKPFLVMTHGAQALRIRVTIQTAGGSVTPNYALLPATLVHEVVAFSPTAANFNVTATLGAGSASVGTVVLGAGAATIGALTANQSVNLAQIGGNSTLTGGTNGSLGVGGLAANGASVSGNPILHGGRAQNAEITAVTNGQAVDAAYDLVGKQIIMPFANKENFLTGSSGNISTATNTSLISAQAAGVKIYLTGFSCANTGSTTSLIQFTSGSGGTVLWTTINPTGGGTNGTISPPVATAAATALFVTTGSASTNQLCSVTGYAGT